MPPESPTQTSRFTRFENDLHSLFHTTSASTDPPDINWSDEHDELVTEFAEAVYESDPYENYSYKRIYNALERTVEENTLEECIDDPHLENFAETLLENESLAEDFLAQYRTSYLIQNHDNDAIEK